MKKIISYILTFAMLTAGLPVSSLAQEFDFSAFNNLKKSLREAPAMSSTRVDHKFYDTTKFMEAETAAFRSKLRNGYYNYEDASFRSDIKMAKEEIWNEYVRTSRRASESAYYNLTPAQLREKIGDVSAQIAALFDKNPQYQKIAKKEANIRTAKVCVLVAATLVVAVFATPVLAGAGYTSAANFISIGTVATGTLSTAATGITANVIAAGMMLAADIFLSISAEYAFDSFHKASTDYINEKKLLAATPASANLYDNCIVDLPSLQENNLLSAPTWDGVDYPTRLTMLKSLSALQVIRFELMDNGDKYRFDKAVADIDAIFYSEYPELAERADLEKFVIDVRKHESEKLAFKN